MSLWVVALCVKAQYKSKCMALTSPSLMLLSENDVKASRALKAVNLAGLARAFPIFKNANEAERETNDLRERMVVGKKMVRERKVGI